MPTYKVVPFLGRLKSDQAAGEVSAQLQAVINENATQGWELDQVQAVNIQVSPGCLAGLLGAKETYVKYDQVIFRKS